MKKLLLLSFAVTTTVALLSLFVYLNASNEDELAETHEALRCFIWSNHNPDNPIVYNVEAISANEFSNRITVFLRDNTDEKGENLKNLVIAATDISNRNFRIIYFEQSPGMPLAN